MNVNANASVLAACKPWTRAEIAARAAHDIPEGFYVNLGIGIPVLVADNLPADREIIIQSENGVLGMGPAPAPDKINRWLINAGKQYVTLRSRRLLHASRRQLRAHPRRPSRSLRARRLPGRRERRSRQLGDLRQRPHASRGRRHGPCRRGPADLGTDGAHHQDGREPAQAPVQLSAHRARRGQARLHQSRRA